MSSRTLRATNTTCCARSRWIGRRGDGRTLFLVGDPMQSIYGFRNAEVGRFSTVRAAGLDGLPLTTLELRRNFRSAPALVHWCNDVFSRVFPGRG